jgi:serine/threonine-protein kinase
MSQSKFERFGKYLILDHLVDGGMAKICRASYLGEQANKIVAIKMVQAQYSKDPSFVQMFEDELKVSFDLLHPNIAQVYDYGMVDDQLYSAMEYIDGLNLKQFLDRLKEKKFVFPVEISTYIISQVCQALHYAHNFTDKLTGKSFNIVHRDISPHNIMLTYAGVVKVIDFGIAKADSNAEATQAGTIKGKLSYLAPECLDGMELDHRYDQFAVGISLWEMLCSRKLFKAKNELAVLKQIQACKVPRPSSINPNVPKDLDDIVLKALSRDRSQRFENMDKMNRALVRFLYSNYPEFNPTDLGYFAKQLFKDEITADKKKFVEFGKINMTPYLDDLKRSEQHGTNGDRADQLEKTADGSFISEAQRTGKIEIDLGNFDKHTTAIGELSLELKSGETATGVPLKNKTGSSKVKRSTNGKTGVSAAKNTKNTTQIGSGSRTGSTRVKRGGTAGKTRVTKVRSGTSVNKRTTQQKSGSGLMPIGIAVAIILFVFTQNHNIGYPLCSVSKTRCEKKETKVVPLDHFGAITFTGYDSSLSIEIDGEPYNVKGITIDRILLGEYKQLVVKKDGYKTWVYPNKVKLTKDKPFASILIPDLEPYEMGNLSSSNNFSPGSVLVFEVDGKQVEKDLPFKGQRFPAGTYNGTIENRLLGTKRSVQFKVIENKNEVIK